MTRASAARIAKRAESYEFQMPTCGMSERIDLIPFELVLGVQHPLDSPMLVVAWDGHSLKRMLPEQANQWADELVAAGMAVPLAPVIEAIRKLVRWIGDTEAAVIMRRTSLSEMPVAGSA